MKAALLAAALLAAAPTFAQTPYLVKDIYPGIEGSQPAELVSVGSRVFFTARQGNTNETANYELWVSDGRAGGTFQVKDIAEGGASSFPQHTVSFGEGVCFVAQTISGGFKPWCSDGTDAGSQILVDGISDFALRSNLAVFRGRLYFLAFADSKVGLWSTDGTSAGTALVGVLPGDGTEGVGYNQELVATPNRLFMQFSSTNGMQLWSTDGTPEGLVRVPFPDNHLLDSRLSVWGSRVLFTLTVPSSSSTRGLWITDGSPEGTRSLRNERMGEDFIFVGGSATADVYVFAASESPAYQTKLWRTDGTSEGTWPFEEGCVPTCSFNPTEFFFDWNGTAWFLAYGSDDGGNGSLWRTDGTPAGTQQRIVSASLSFPIGEIASGGRLYLTAFASGGRRLFVSDGTTEGTQMLRTLAGPVGVDGNQKMVVAGTTLFFSGWQDRSNSTELWALANAFPVASEVSETASALGLRAAGARSVELTAPAGAVRVEAFDLLGRRVALLHDGDASGTLRLALPPTLGAGAYVVRTTGASGDAASVLVRAR